MALKRYPERWWRFVEQSCSPLLRGDGPETPGLHAAHVRAGTCSPLLRGDGPETARPAQSCKALCGLAVPSYGAMALKLQVDVNGVSGRTLAVPSYGAMALKPWVEPGQHKLRPTCSPLLRGDGPETWKLDVWHDLLDDLAVPSYGAMALKPLAPANGGELGWNLQSPPTGRWP